MTITSPPNTPTGTTPSSSPEMKSAPSQSSVTKNPQSEASQVPNKKKTLGRVVVVTSGKGGVGKTTSTANIGTGLAHLGYRVAMIDADIGLRNLDILMGLENRIVYNIVDVVEERCKLSQALVKDKRMPNLALLPAAQTRDKTALNEEQMRGVCEKLREDWDFILVDSPAGIEQGFLNAAAAATEAIVVCTPEMSAVRDADRIIGLLEAREDITQYQLVLNRVRGSMMKSNDMMNIDDVVELLSIKLLGIIPEDPEIIISTNKGDPIVLTESQYSGQAYRNICQRLVGEDIPLMDLNPDVSWVDRLKGFFTKTKSA